MSDIDECCSVCFRRVGINTGDDGTPPVDLGRCAAPGGFECRAVGQAVAGYRRENEVLRSNSDHLSSENASLSSQVESMAMRIESLAEELAKPEDARLREVLDALEGRAVIFDGLGARVGHLLDELDEWIERAGAAERRLKKAEEVVLMARQLTAYAWEDRLEDCEVSDSAKHDSRVEHCGLALRPRGKVVSIAAYNRGSRLVAREADERMPVATSRADAQANKDEIARLAANSAAKERARIVTALRDLDLISEYGAVPSLLADAIERGEL